MHEGDGDSGLDNSGDESESTGNGVQNPVDEIDEDTPDLSELDPILYVVGPDIVRERRRVALSLTSGLGLATCWYLSLYPFLLNPALASRVDEELALVDAGMTPDLSCAVEVTIGVQ